MVEYDQHIFWTCEELRIHITVQQNNTLSLRAEDIVSIVILPSFLFTPVGCPLISIIKVQHHDVLILPRHGLHSLQHLNLSSTTRRFYPDGSVASW